MNTTSGLILTAVGLAFAASAALALEPLQVQLTNGCPTSVASNQESCTTGQKDPVNQACQVNNGAVRWQSDKPIETIATKSGSPGALQNCREVAGLYQCIVLGQAGDQVSYFVTLKDPDCATLDPIIIIK